MIVADSIRLHQPPAWQVNALRNASIHIPPAITLTLAAQNAGRIFQRMHLTTSQLDAAVEQAKRYARTIAHLDLNADPQGQGSALYQSYLAFWGQFRFDWKLSLAIGWGYGKEYSRIVRLHKLARQASAAVG